MCKNHYSTKGIQSEDATKIKGKNEGEVQNMRVLEPYKAQIPWGKQK